MNRFTIKQWRLIKGLTQREFAKKVGINYLTYQAKEAGKRPWKAEEIKAISTFLEVSIDKELIY